MNGISNHYLDARRLLCPMPVIRVQEKIKQLAAGDVIEVICTDPGVLQDIPAWCRVHGHKILASDCNQKEITIKIEKGA